MGKGEKKMAYGRPEKYERETIISTSEADDVWNVYTFNRKLKNRLRKFAEANPEICILKEENQKLGFVIYEVLKPSLAIRLNKPYSEERRNMARELAKRNSANILQTGTN